MVCCTLLCMKGLPENKVVTPCWESIFTQSQRPIEPANILLVHRLEEIEGPSDLEHFLAEILFDPHSIPLKFANGNSGQFYCLYFSQKVLIFQWDHESGLDGS